MRLARNILWGVGFAGALAASGPAAADDMAVGELVGVTTQEDCMARAQRTLETYRDRFGASGVIADTWTVYLFNADLDGFDVVIMCPTVEDAVGAFAVVHGPEGSEPIEVFRRIRQLWN